MLRDVLGRPFIEHVMRNLRRFGFNRFLLLAGNKGESVHERYSAGSAFAREIDADIRVLVEPEPLGTAGALKFAAPELAEEFLLLNGDSLFDFNYLDLTHCTRPGEPGDWLARVALLPAENADRCGFVQLNGCSISPLREKPAQPESGLVNSGVYWLRSDILEWIDQLPCSLEQDIFPRLAAANALVGRAYQGFFIDISSPGDPERAGRELECALRKPAVFLDRDGTLNHDAGYTHRVADFHWVAGATTAIRALNDAGYLVFIVTNQAGIARGYYDARAVAQLHAWMQAELRQLGAHIDDLRYCPHHPEGSVADLAITCDCRKPATGMLDSLIAQWQPDLTRSFMLGDAAKDAAAGNAAGVTGR
ncbi:MAG: HAD-IIIA family hydrolase, partial [Halioglobus sp.]|nr:HAD-IIIA family hydrolase [Halioglobus sp.]